MRSGNGGGLGGREEEDEDTKEGERRRDNRGSDKGIINVWNKYPIPHTLWV